jgi:hypothetical protein
LFAIAVSLAGILPSLYCAPTEQQLAEILSIPDLAYDYARVTDRWKQVLPTIRAHPVPFCRPQKLAESWEEPVWLGSLAGQVPPAEYLALAREAVAAGADPIPWLDVPFGFESLRADLLRTWPGALAKAPDLDALARGCEKYGAREFADLLELFAECPPELDAAIAMLRGEAGSAAVFNSLATHPHPEIVKCMLILRHKGWRRFAKASPPSLGEPGVRILAGLDFREAIYLTLLFILLGVVIPFCRAHAPSASATS